MTDRNYHRWPDEENSAGTCVVCDRYIDYEVGVIIDGSDTPVVCVECWGKLTPVEKLDQVRQWRLARKQTECLEAVQRLCDGAIDGYHLPRGGLGEAGRN